MSTPKNSEALPPTTGSAFAPREVQQALGPHRPRTRVLAVMLDTIPANYEIEEIVVNGQTGKVLVICWDGKGTTYRQFNSRQNSQDRAPA